MNLNYGFAKIEIGDKEYTLKPTLENIKQIGSPKKIVECFSILHYKAHHYITSFREAVNILNCCGLPEEVTGWTEFSERSNKILIRQGLIPVCDVFTLAEHCLAHGVTGVVESDDDDADKTGEPLTEFDAHSFIVDATEFLGVTLAEAERLTMTQFVFLVKAKNKNYEKRKLDNDHQSQGRKQSEKDVKEALEFYKEKVEKINKSRRLSDKEIEALTKRG